MSPNEHKSGYVALVGRPNAGKSTLMNALLGDKISIITPKPQTTRHQIVGIHSTADSQIIFLDTPGIIEPRYKLQEAMMDFVEKARKDADLVLFLVESTEREIPDYVFEVFEELKQPVLLVVNKMDLSSEKQVEPMVNKLNGRYKFVDVVYISALQGTGIEELKQKMIELLPAGPPFYPKDIISKHPVRFFVAELIREQIFMQFQEEIPYSCTVDIVDYNEGPDLDRINAEIIVNRKSQKGMLIGKKGSAIKKLGTESRKAIEAFVGKQVYLDLHVKVREKWREKEGMLKHLGYK